MSGFPSPWAKREEPPADPLEGATKGKQPVRVQGRAYSIFVELPFRLPEDRATPLALNAIGEALTYLESQGPALAEELERQKLSITGRLPGPCVELPFGSRVLFALASSNHEAIARLMAVDRLALAFTRLNLREPRTTSILKEHFINIVRTA